MDSELISRWNKKISENDIVNILGDFSIYNKDKTQEIINLLNGKKRLVIGSHDNETKLCDGFFEIIDRGIILDNNRKVVISHYPELFYQGAREEDTFMLYGHLHKGNEHKICENLKKVLKEQAAILNHQHYCKLYNVGCMFYDYEPQTLDEIIMKSETIESKGE